MVFLKIGVSQNGWFFLMFFSWKPLSKRDDLGGFPPIFWKHPYPIIQSKENHPKEATQPTPYTNIYLSHGTSKSYAPLGFQTRFLLLTWWIYRAPWRTQPQGSQKRKGCGFLELPLKKTGRLPVLSLKTKKTTKQLDENGGDWICY